MMDFPSTPTVGQVFGNYTWDGEKWVLSAASGSGGGGIPEAPIDGTIYGRKNAAWAAVSAGVSSAAGFRPGGRLTFSSTLAVMTANVTGATTIYYLPHETGAIPIYDGTAWSLADISAGISQLTTDTTKSPAAVVASSIYDLFVWNDAGTIRLSRGPLWTNLSTRALTLTRQNGIWTNTSNITNGPLAARGTWVGTFLSNGAAQGDWIRGSSNFTGAGQATLNLWNAYNRVDIRSQVGELTGSWTYGSASWRSANGAAGNRVGFVLGNGDDEIDAHYSVMATSSTTGYASVGIGVDNTTTNAGVTGTGPYQPGTVTVTGQAVASFRGKLAAGSHTINALEYAGAAVTYYGQFGGSQSMGLFVNLKM